MSNKADIIEFIGKLHCHYEILNTFTGNRMTLEQFRDTIEEVLICDSDLIDSDFIRINIHSYKEK